MGLLSGLVGIGKVASNFFGGGAGDSQTTNSSQTTKLSGTQTSKSQGQTIASQREFSDPFLALLETITADALGSSAQGSAAIRDQIAKVSKAGLGDAEIPFDVNKFVEGITRAGTDRINQDLEAGVNETQSNIGGSDSGNSMAALLAGRLRTSAAAEIAGIESNATGQGMQIKSALRELRNKELESESQQVAGLSGSVDSNLTSLLAALKGGEKFTEQANSEASATTTNQSTVTSGTSTTKQPFNWAKGFGNLFNFDED